MRGTEAPNILISFDEQQQSQQQEQVLRKIRGKKVIYMVLTYIMSHNLIPILLIRVI